MSDFYIGYLPHAAPTLARRIRRLLLVLVGVASAIATALVTSQHQFAVASFEYAQPRTFRGVLEVAPVPLLRVRRPGAVASESRYPLVGAGKHGVEGLNLLDGREVELRAMLIFRDGATLLEVLPNSVRARSSRLEGRAPVADLGVQTLTGEIVDTKCYAGVMNPGQGKVHRDCAARCISGGIPPALLSQGTLYYLITDGGPAPAAALLEYVSRPVIITGRVSRSGDTLYLHLASQGIACARRSLKQ